MTNKQTLCLDVKWAYIAVRESCDTNRILGTIEKKHQGGGYPGTLNFKEALLKLTHTPTTAPLTQANPPGRMRRGSGTGFNGWIDYVTIRKAIAFLKAHVNLVLCPIAGVVVCTNGKLIPIPLPDNNRQNEWSALKDAIERAIRKGLAPKEIVFRRGNNPIPEDIRRWCAEQGIKIVILDDATFDRQHPLPDLSGDFNDLPPWIDTEGNPFF